MSKGTGTTSEEENKYDDIMKNKKVFRELIIHHIQVEKQIAELKAELDEIKERIGEIKTGQFQFLRILNEIQNDLQKLKQKESEA
jgi:hypothetical protein